MPASSPKTINRVLWIAQSLTALLFLFAGFMKFVTPVEQMQQGGVSLPGSFIHFIGICECLGALGLLLPGILRIHTWLTPLAAAGLTIIMAGAVSITIPAMGVAAAIFPAVVGIVTSWIAYGRSTVAPVRTAPRRVLQTV